MASRLTWSGSASIALISGRLIRGMGTYAVYVFSLPMGPVWALHGFHLCATGLMLFWYIRHAGQPHSLRSGPPTRQGSDKTIRRSA
jgi:hypothetical protein